VTTILVVDDEPDLEILIRRRFRQQVRDGSMTLLFAQDGVEALELIARHPEIDVVLTDIRMPRMDGLTLIGKLQESERPLATVVVSAYGDMENIRTAMNSGAFDFLTKPMDFADLQSTIAKAQRHVTALRQARTQAAELRRQREALLQSEKMAAFGKLLAGVSHELNNPLSILIVNAIMLQEEAAEATAPALASKAERIRVAAERCARIVRSFLAMARQQDIRKRPVDVAALMDGVLDLLAPGLRSDGIQLLRSVPSDVPPILGDADQLHQVLTNLVTNARQALEGQDAPRTLRIEVQAVSSLVEILVADNGPGIPADMWGRIFDPFFTTKPVGSGTGMGLAVSRGIAEAHGGSLDLATSSEPGACFVLRLPRATGEDAAPDTPEPALAATPLAGSRSALIIEDEVELANSLQRMLALLGFRCDLAATGREAQRLLSDRDYDVILCDLRIPELSGEDLYRWLAAHRRHLCGRMAFLTGDAMSPATNGFLDRSRRPVLEKPFMPQDVRRLVSELVSEPSNRP